MMDAAWRGALQLLDRCIGGARGERPVVADAEVPTIRLESDRDLHTVFEHKRRAGSGHRDDSATRRRVEVDDQRAVDVAHFAFLIPATDAGVPLTVGLDLRVSAALTGRQRPG